MFSNNLLLTHPFYCDFRLKHPLPTNPTSQTPFLLESVSDQEGGYAQATVSSFSDEDSGPKEVRTRRPNTSKTHPARRSTTRKSRSGSESDEEIEATPLGTSFISNKHQQRLNQYDDTMAPRKEKTSAAQMKRVADDWKQKAMAAEAEVERLKKKPKIITVTAPNKAPKEMKDWTPRQKAVFECAKKVLSQKIKFIYYNQDKLITGTRICMEHLNPEELEGLEGDALEDAESEWIANYQDFVRLGINEYRNYSQSEMKALFEKLYVQSLELILTDPGEMLNLALRRGIVIQEQDAEGNYFGPGSHPDDADVKLWEAKQDCYFDHWLGKVAGQEVWSRPTIKYYELASEVVDPGTEAFLVVQFENGFQKWKKKMEQKAAGTYDKDAFAKAERDRVKAGFAPLMPYTTATSGACPWGGWNAKGRSRYRQIRRQIIKNREQDREYIKFVEENARKRIHAAAGRVTIDSNKKNPKANRRAVVHVADESDDEEF